MSQQEKDLATVIRLLKALLEKLEPTGIQPDTENSGTRCSHSGIKLEVLLRDDYRMYGNRHATHAISCPRCKMELLVILGRNLDRLMLAPFWDHALKLEEEAVLASRETRIKLSKNLASWLETQEFDLNGQPMDPRGEA